MARRRIYWLLPDLRSAQRAMDDLLLARIEERHIHFIARDGTDMTGLHSANVLQSSDVIRAAQMGLCVGGATGATAGGLLAAFMPDIGGPGLIGVLAVAGGLFGTWAASLIGVSTPSKRLKRFEGAIEQGQVLLMVDVPRSRVEEIEAKLQVKHPEAHLQGVEPDIPAFP